MAIFERSYILTCSINPSFWNLHVNFRGVYIKTPTMTAWVKLPISPHLGASSPHPPLRPQQQRQQLPFCCRNRYSPGDGYISHQTGSSENHHRLKMPFWGGYVSSLEGMYVTVTNIIFIKHDIFFSYPFYIVCVAKNHSISIYTTRHHIYVSKTASLYPKFWPACICSAWESFEALELVIKTKPWWSLQALGWILPKCWNLCKSNVQSSPNNEDMI